MHNTTKFKFLDNDGKEVEFESVPYSFDLEEKVLEARFGKDTLEEFAKTHVLNFKIRFEHVEEDMPKLLVGNLSNINFKTQPDFGEKNYYEEIRKVYYFFLEYDSNAQLRLSEQLKETLASSIKTLKVTLDGMPEIISTAVKDKNTTSN